MGNDERDIQFNLLDNEPEYTKHSVPLFNYYEINWEDTLTKLKNEFVINMNYGAPSSSYIPMASYRVVALIDTSNNYSRTISLNAKPEDIIVELEKFEVDARGEIVPDHSYKLYIPFSKLTREDVIDIAIKNKDEFKKKTSGVASQKNVSIITGGLQAAIAADAKLATTGIRLHREKSIGLDELDARLVHVSEEIMPNGELRRDSQDISASNTSLAIYGGAPLVKSRTKFLSFGDMAPKEQTYTHSYTNTAEEEKAPVPKPEDLCPPRIEDPIPTPTEPQIFIEGKDLDEPDEGYRPKIR